MKHTALLATLLTASACHAGTTVVVEIAEVPPHIMEIARSAAPSAVFEKADVETEDDGTAVYEIIGTETEFTFETVASDPSEIDLTALENDGFGLQLSKVTLRNVTVEVDILPDLSIEEIERVIPLKLVPGMVMKRIERSYPGFAASRVEASYNSNGKIFQYELEGERDDRKLDLEVSADGSDIEETDA